MDKARAPLPSSDVQQPSITNVDTRPFVPGPYLPPPPIQPGGDRPWNALQMNMPGACSGEFWPGYNNPPPYLPPPQQPPHQEWTTPAPGFAGPPYGYGPPISQPPPIFDGYGPPFPHQGFGFDRSLPPPPPLANHPGPGRFPPVMNEFQGPTLSGTPHSDSNSPRGPGRAWASDATQLSPGPFDLQSAYVPPGSQHRPFGFHPDQHPNPNMRVDHADHGSSEDRRPLLSTPLTAPLGTQFQGTGALMDKQSLSEDDLQRMQDEQWLKRFLRNKSKRPRQNPEPKNTSSQPSVSQMRDTLYSAVELVSELSVACEALKDNLENEGVWADSYSRALSVKKDLQEKLKILSDPECVSGLKRNLRCISRRRARHHRRKLIRMEEKQLKEEQRAEKEAAVDRWRMKRILEVEEKKRDQDLKLAADAVLSEVRKKQADVKRMLDILRSLEKLRKLRKEAASRKGIFPELASDQVFDRQVEQLRGLLRKRTAVYAAEENTLRVMLEGEQEEERKRDLEKRQKKEKEKLLKKKKEMEIMLFGDEMHPDHPLQAFRGYYTQAERSVAALVQIRREWDMCLVPVSYPDGTAVPQDWVLPEAPSDEIWASALDRDSCPD